LEAAEEVFDQNPLATLDDVARAAGLSRMTIYRHFKTREELLETLTIEGLKVPLKTVKFLILTLRIPKT
jgi:AcrR family transcriptional regulator